MFDINNVNYHTVPIRFFFIKNRKTHKIGLSVTLFDHFVYSENLNDTKVTSEVNTAVPK